MSAKGEATRTNSRASLRAFEKRIGYTFRNRSLLNEALTHPSRQGEDGSATAHNQRLEFLGDSVLGLILSEELFRLHPDAREGELSRQRATLVCGPFVSGLARELGIGERLHLSRSEVETGGRDRDKSLEDALEALVGAVYLDGGLAAARRVVLGWYRDIPGHLAKAAPADNPKGRLQEEIQALYAGEGPLYRVVREDGPSHDPHFEIEVRFRGRTLGSGSGSSKKEAESRAAEGALRALRENPTAP